MPQLFRRRPHCVPPRSPVTEGVCAPTGRPASCALALGLSVWLLACGGAPPPAGPQLDVFHDTYLRGHPARDAAPRVALTLEAPTACTAAVLARLREPGPKRPPLVATFFFDRVSLARAADADAAGLRALLERMVAEGHGIALGVPEIPASWRDDPAAFRSGLAAEAREVADLLRAHGVRDPGALRLWRPRSVGLDLAALGGAAEADRPLVLWSLFAEADDPAVMVGRLASRLSDGDIVALPGGGGGCPLVEALPLLDEALGTAGLRTVRLDEVLSVALARHSPLQVVRFHGPGASAACSGAARDAGPADPTLGPRWGLVDGELPDGAVRVLPLPGRAESTARLVEHDLEHARAIWARREVWRGMPACLRALTPQELASPVFAEEDRPQPRWFAVGSVGVEPRDASRLAGPNAPVLLPTRADLVRLEARGRIPYVMRGVVADALEHLGLHVPLLVEARATAGVVVASALEPAVLDGADAEERLREALGGYVQLSEVTLAEYLFLARRSTREPTRLAAAAHGSDGFLRAGPYLTIPSTAGGSPNPAVIGPNGVSAFKDSPSALLARVLVSGTSLRAGDVVAAASPPPVGAPAVSPALDAPSVRQALVEELADALQAGFTTDTYLRPGAVMAVEGDLLGTQVLRVVVPGGVAVPSPDASPLVGDRPAAPPTRAPAEDAVEPAEEGDRGREAREGAPSN